MASSRPAGSAGVSTVRPSRRSRKGQSRKKSSAVVSIRLVASWRRCGTAASRRFRRGILPRTSPRCRGRTKRARATRDRRHPVAVVGQGAPAGVGRAAGRRRVPVPDLHDVPANCWPTAPPNSRPAATTRPADRPRRPRLVKGVHARGVPAGRPRGDQKPRAAALLQRQPLQRSEPEADPRGHLLSFGLPDAAAVHRACTTPAWSPTTAATCCASASGLPRPRGRRTGGGAARGRAPPRTAAEPPLPFVEDWDVDWDGRWIAVLAV